MTTQSYLQLDEDLRQLLRRIEDIPSTEADGAPQEGKPSRPLASHLEPKRPLMGLFAENAPHTLPVEVSAADIEGSRRFPVRTVMATTIVAMAAAGVAWTFLPERPASLSLTGRDMRSTPPSTQASLSMPMPVPGTRAAPPAGRAELVLNSVSASAGERLPAQIRVEVGTLTDNGFRLALRGLPTGIRLSHGRFFAPDTWVVAGGDIEPLEFIVDGALTGQYELTGELQSLDGRALRTTTSMFSVTAPQANRSGMKAAAADLAASSTIITIADEKSQDKLVAQGLRMLVSGSVNSARLLFERAAAAGNARAALLMGDTYDDVRLTQIGVDGVMPDRERANYWYCRADELGASEAKERLWEINSR
jgi:hypothetical protein